MKAISIGFRLNKGIVKDRCKTPDSPEGARQATTPHSPSQSSPPLRSVASPPTNCNADSLTPPPPLPAATALSLETPRSFSDIPYGSLGGYPTGRQLTKVKKFLSTLVQFGSDISSDVGERVKSLVLNLVSSNLSIEEFHHSLQDVTNFPLRPFVLPFLRTHMPLLQREIHTLARVNKLSALQYARSHDHVLLELTHSPSEASEIFMSNDNAPLSGIKRRSPEGVYENGLNGQPEEYPSAKRPAPVITPFLLNHHQQSFFLPTMNGPNVHLFDYPPTNAPTIKTEEQGGSRGDEEWRNIHVMLNCILSMVEKTKRALAILQQRNLPTQPDPTNEWLRKQDVSQDLKKVANEIISTAIRAAEERVAEVRRRAEEAVGDVKRQAVMELQRAVAAAEARAGELLAAERARVEKAIGEARKQSDEATGNHAEFGDSNQTPSGQTVASQQNACWNCGRKAHDTCSGCSMARYCSPFCQHKDWENHHQVSRMPANSGSLHQGKAACSRHDAIISSDDTDATDGGHAI
ncbi:hypothetical protein HUJ05_006886 [Dendroctonus ponderosae]|nr:hypothetical protein HUJ05_006886 [Dendroctonus ponderosae]